jgi:hypothetical protein
MCEIISDIIAALPENKSFVSDASVEQPTDHPYYQKTLT